MHTTSSGLTILIRETPGVGVATVDAWIGVGSADETPEIGGVSHFLEHMLFKGTERFGPGDMDRLIEGLGGILNAGTSKDFTHYYMTVPAGEFPTAVDTLADALSASTIDPEEFEKERGVILEEISRKEDNPYGHLFDELYETAFVAGPYRRGVLGEAGVIGALPRETMRDYRGRYYAADNTTLVIVGDVKAEDAIEKAERAFAGFAGEARPPEGLDRSARWNTGARTIVDKDVREVYAATAFPAPGLADPRSVVVCDVLETALATGRASRLVRELKERRRIVTSISGAFPTHRHDSLLAVIATLEPERLDEYRAALEEELARLRDKKLPSKELRRAKRLLINAHRFSKETSTGAASVLGYYYTLTGSTGFEADYVDTVESVTAQEVLEAARTVFDPTQAVWVVLRPKSKP